MTNARMGALMAQAQTQRNAVGAFNAITLEHAEGIVAGAEQAGLPVVLQISENTVGYHGGLAPLALAALSLAAESSAPVVVHLDHATKPALVRQAVELGITSIMVDGSHLPDAENIALTRDLADWCHQRDVFVEAELGEIGGKNGAHAPNARTDPGEAATFVAATRVDSLAVAVGTSHAMRTRDATVDVELVARLAHRLDVPLVLHGSSGVPDENLAEAIAHGIGKVNIATRLNGVLTHAVRSELNRDEMLVDPRRYLGMARKAISDEVARLLKQLAGPGTATQRLHL